MEVTRLRGVALGLVCALLTSVGHAMAGGGLPDASLMVVVLPLLGGAFVALAEHVRSWQATVGALAAGQLVLHACLAALHPMPADPPAMLGAHVLITAVMTVAVRHADAAVLAVSAVLSRAVPRRLAPPVADRPLPTRPVPAPDLPARLARLLTLADVRRGPPVRVGPDLHPFTPHRSTSMSRSPRRALLRAATLLGATAALALVGATPAFAHVTANPGTAQKGGYGVVTFRVPDEDETAGTVALTVTLPADHPFSSVRTTPVAGWAITTNEIPLNPPLKDDDGNQITKTIGSVTWKANPGTKIAPGQYLDFPVSLGPFPDDVDVIRMPAAQTYDNGQVVNWADPPNADGSEPEHPAPAVTLSAAANGAAAADPMNHGMTATAAPSVAPAAQATGEDTTARWLGGVGLLVGALGLGVGGGAVLRSRRRTESSAGKSD